MEKETTTNVKLTPDAYYELAGKPAHMTRWLNQTAVDVTIDIALGPTLDREFEETMIDPMTDVLRTIKKTARVSAFIRYIVPAKGELEIPSQWDRAIHTPVNGVIIAGLAPQLVRGDGKGFPVDPSLIVGARAVPQPSAGAKPLVAD